MPNSKAEYIARRLLDKIVVSNLPPGSNFGTEADLLSQFDVSRPTLRESLRILESQGVLELRPGPKGGILTKRPGTEILAHGLSIYLRMHQVPFSAVLGVREAIEPTLAAEAATNGTEDDFAKLQDSIDRMRLNSDPEAFSEENRTFHSLIATASANKVLEVFWATISILAAGEEHGIQYPEGTQTFVIDAHQKILDACRSRDGAEAARRMREHVNQLARYVFEHHPDVMDRKTAIFEPDGRRVN